MGQRTLQFGWNSIQTFDDKKYLHLEYWTSVFHGFEEHLARNGAVVNPWRCCFIPATDNGFRSPLETVIDSHVKLQRASRRGLFPRGLTGCNFL